MSDENIVAESLARIEQWEPHIGAFSEVFSESARAAVQEDHEGVLAGKTIAVKDIICTEEGHTTASSKLLEQFRSPFDATVVSRLKQAGAIVVGKVSCDEFAMGVSNEYAAAGPVRNPWDVSKVPGGSSGGSAAAVAAGEAWGALGTDTGGSTRYPASYCNVVGLKPSYGRISRFGVIAYASSFDQVGPIARTVRDVADITEAIAGHDARDATTRPEPVGELRSACEKGVAGMTIGIPEEFLGDDVDPAITALVREAIADLEKQGATTKRISLPLTHAAIPVYYLLVKAEASSNLSRYDGLRYGEVDVEGAQLLEHYVEARGKYFGPEVKRSILMGTYALSAGYVDAWYKQASKVRTLIQQEFSSTFESVDVIAGPVTAELPWEVNSDKKDDPLAMYMADALTTPASVAGIAAMSVPCGFSNGLPVGLQLIAPALQEERLFQVAATYEDQHDWHAQQPQLPQ